MVTILLEQILVKMVNLNFKLYIIIFCFYIYHITSIIISKNDCLIFFFGLIKNYYFLYVMINKNENNIILNKY